MNEEIIVKKKKKRNNNTSVVLVTSILLSFVCGMLGSFLVMNSVVIKSDTNGNAIGTVIKNITTSELVETSIATSVSKVYNKTVAIIAFNKGKQVSTGTGFVYKVENEKAYIMTNNHVVDDGDSAKIEFNNSTERIEAKIVGGDTYADVAVLTIDAKHINEAVEIGKSADVKLGDTIFTVGAPMGVEYKGTVTKGILSGLDRMVQVSLSNTSVSDYYMKVMQMDAAVNPGNSGGPLCDVSGKVIGLISLKIVQDEVEGMGFAIPIEVALEHADMIEKGGKVVRPFIGISMVDVSQEYYLYQNKIMVPENVTYGVVVVEVSKGSPAEKAKFQKADVIVKIAGEEVKSLAEFRYELYRHKVGETVEFEFYRNGKLMKTSMVLGKSE